MGTLRDGCLNLRAEATGGVCCRAITGALASCSELADLEGERLEDACNAFIRRHLLPALNRLGADGW